MSCASLRPTHGLDLCLVSFIHKKTEFRIVRGTLILRKGRLIEKRVTREQKDHEYVIIERRKPKKESVRHVTGVFIVHAINAIGVMSRVFAPDTV